MPPKNKRSVKTYEKDEFVVVGSDSEPDTKRKKAEPTKSTATARKETGQQYKDDEGNPYWEVLAIPSTFGSELLTFAVGRSSSPGHSQFVQRKNAGQHPRAL